MIRNPVLKVSSQITPEISEASQRRRLVSLTPLIDVVFILLIFFLLTLTLSEYSAIPLSVSTQAAGGNTQTTALLVKLNVDRTVEVDNQRVSLDEAAAVLEKLYRRDPALTLVIRSAEGVDIQQLVDFTDKLAGVDITDISLTQ